LVYNIKTDKTISIGRIKVKSKRITSIFLVFCLVLPIAFLIFSTGCAQRGTVEPDYSAAIAEKVLIAISKDDYDSVSTYFNKEFKDSLKAAQIKLIDPETQKAYVFTSEKDAFVTVVCKPLRDKIGEYQQGSLKFDRTLTEKGYTSVFYLSKYSKETNGNVTTQLVFKDESGKMVVSGLWFSSKILSK
jgi:hypothetical protein